MVMEMAAGSALDRTVLVHSSVEKYCAVSVWPDQGDMALSNENARGMFVSIRRRRGVQ
jgi:hypothetical protein